MWARLRVLAVWERTVAQLHITDILVYGRELTRRAGADPHSRLREMLLGAPHFESHGREAGTAGALTSSADTPQRRQAFRACRISRRDSRP